MYKIMKFLKQILNGWDSFFAAIRYRCDSYEWWEWDRDFWEEINIGFYEMEIFPYDDWYNPTISKQRQLILGQKPPTIYLSLEDFDSLCRKLDEPPDPAITKRIEKIMLTPAPWDENK